MYSFYYLILGHCFFAIGIIERFKNKTTSYKYILFALLFGILFFYSHFMSYRSNFFKGKK